MGIQNSRFVDRSGSVYLPCLTEWKQVFMRGEEGRREKGKEEEEEGVKGEM